MTKYFFASLHRFTAEFFASIVHKLLFKMHLANPDYFFAHPKQQMIMICRLQHVQHCVNCSLSFTHARN